jgi:hypothetical protein
MDLARFLPFWNSLDSVRHIHSDLSFAAIVFFGLLALFDVLAHLSDDKNRERNLERIGLWCFGIAVLFELVAYPYGERNDTLSERVIVSLDQKAGEADAKARSALTASSAAKTKADAVGKKANELAGKLDTLSASADDLSNDLDGIQDTISARQVADEKGLEDDLRKDFKGRHIVFKSYAGLGDTEPFWLCEQLLEIAKKAEVEPVGKCATEPLGAVPVTHVRIDAPTIAEGQHLAMLLKKQKVLNGWSIARVPGFGVTLRGGIPDVAVMVGVRPSIPSYPWLLHPSRKPTKSKVKP